MSWRKLIGNKESVVLPHFGGATVDAPGRRLRVSTDVNAGYWRFEIAGRTATPVEPAEPPDLSNLPRERGHFACGWLFFGGAREERVELLPAEEPAVLSPLSARRWASGALLFEALEFESEAEDLARRALEEERPLAELKGVAASLRAAFGFALASAIGQSLRVPISPREVRGAFLAFAERGREAVLEHLGRLEEQRRFEAIRVASFRPAPTSLPQPASAEERMRRSLDSAGATLLAERDLGDGSIEVTFRFQGERFISIVDARTLQVYDAGICLSGEDRLVNLDSLPSVIREAIDTSRLVITRR
jgi:hypothetical protein